MEVKSSSVHSSARLKVTSFFTTSFLGATHFFYSWAVFGLDNHFTIELILLYSLYGVLMCIVAGVQHVSSADKHI